MRSSELGLLGLGAVCALAISVNTGGCQSDDNGTVPTGPGGTGTGGSGAGMGDGGSGAGTTSSSGTAGGGSAAEAQVVTIEDIARGNVGDGAAIEVKGVVVMSPKYLVSKSSSGRCLWGVYLSSPELTETTPYSGILALSYGDDATTGQNQELYCPKLGEEPVGDSFPDDIKPGDVVDLTGRASYFLLNFCGNDECGNLTCTDQERACFAAKSACADGEHQCWEDCSNDPLPYVESKVKQRQISQVGSVVKSGAAPVPQPHLLTAQEMALLSSDSDQSFHDQWGGVKVRISSASAVPWSQGNVVNFGNIVVDTAEGADVQKIQIGNDIYFRGYAPMTDYCHKSPVFSSPAVVWNRIDGFSTLDACTWTLQAVDMCADFDPASDSCSGATSCSQ